MAIGGTLFWVRFPIAGESSFNQLTGHARGAFWMLLAAVFFSFHGPLVRMATIDTDPLMVAFIRSIFVFLMMLPWIIRHCTNEMKTNVLPLHGFRALFSMAGVILLVIAQSKLTLAEVSALTFASPLFATIGAVIFLREVVKARRWICLLYTSPSPRDGLLSRMPSSA